MSSEAIAELAPNGVLRAGINMGNSLLVSGSGPRGDPEGVAPDLAREIATRLGVTVAYVPFARPGELADAAGKGVWDIGLIAAEPARAQTIAFSPAYAEIAATYLVPADSPLHAIAVVEDSERADVAEVRRQQPLEARAVAVAKAKIISADRGFMIHSGAP